MDPLTIGMLGLGGINALKSLFGGGGDKNVPMNDALQQLLTQQNMQFQNSQPLREAIQRLAMGLLPMYAQQGMSGPRAPNSAVPRPGGAIPR